MSLARAPKIPPPPLTPSGLGPLRGDHTSGVHRKGTALPLPVDDFEEAEEETMDRPTLPPPPRLGREEVTSAGRPPPIDIIVVDRPRRRRRDLSDAGGANGDAVVADLRRDPRAEK